MRIGLDFHFLAIPRQGLVRGIPRFAQEQLQAVLELDSDNTYLLLCDAGVDVDAIPAEIRRAPNTHIMCAPDDLARSWPRITDNRTLLSRFSAYEQWLEGLHLDLFHTTCSAMLTGVLMPGFDVCPYVVTAHDLIPLLYPAHYLPDPADRETYEQRLLFLEQATRIAANSHATANDIVDRLGVPPDRIDVTPPAPSVCFRPLPTDAVRSILGALAHPTRLRSRRHVEIPSSYVLCITDLHYSKNLTTLLPAYAELPAATRSRSPLVIAGHLATGEMDAATRLADQLGVGSDLIITGRVSDQELAALYNGSTLTVHPSHHEGFGYPVVEAMRCGAPVLTTTRSALPETAGDAAVLVDSDDTAGFTQAIDLLLHDSERRDDLRRRGIEHAKRYTTVEFGRTTLQCYRAAASTPQRTAEDTTRVALWSPIPPQDCPVAYYTEELVTTLAADPSLEVAIFVDDGVAPPLGMLRAASVHHWSDFERTARRRPFDAILYEVDASPEHAYIERAMLRHPGVAVVHDLRWCRALFGGESAQAEDGAHFRAEVDAREGERAAREWDRLRMLPSRDRTSAEQRFLDEHPMLARLADTATRCVAVTPALGRELRRQYPQAAVDGVIPVGVRDPLRDGYGSDRAPARDFLDLDRDAFLVLTSPGRDGAGSLHPVMRACASLEAAGIATLLTIIGSPPEHAASLRAQAERAGVGEATRIIGHTSRTVSEAYLAACDVVVELDDLGAGVLSQRVIRALAAARCAVVGDSEASRSLPDAACVRVKRTPGAEADISAALLELAGDAARRSRVEHAARAHYENAARLEPMVDGYRDLIRELAGSRPSRRGRARISLPVSDTARAGSPEPRAAPLAYSKVCELEDFAHPQLRQVIRDVCEHKLRAFGDSFPAGYEYRKDWEVAMAVRTLADHGVLRPDARVLGVAAGTEDTVFYLTRHVAEVVAIDRYRDPGNWEETAPPMMLVNPGRLAPYGFRRDHLIVQHMDARILDFPDESFDGIFSSGSIEHFGDLETIAASAYEMGRVLKPGGVLTLSTEFLISPAGSGSSLPGTYLFSSGELLQYIVGASGLQPIDDFDASVSHWTLGTSRNITAAVLDRAAHRSAQPEGTRGPDWAYWDMPHIVMEWSGMRFTSVHLALRRAPAHPIADNAWARPTPELRADVERIAAADAAGAAVIAGKLDELMGVHAAARKRLTRLGLEVAGASETLSADLEEASLPQPGVYSWSLPEEWRPALPPSAPTPEAPPDGTIACRIESTVSPAYTVVVAEDADDIISAAYLAGYGADLNTHLTALVLALVPEGGVFLDIGANIGSITLPVAASGRHVLSVEAEPVNAELLEASARLSGLADRVRVVTMAVGDHVGEASFMPHGCHGQLVGGAVDGAVRVPLTTVDALVEAERMDRLDLVKIDVEGADFDVVRGTSRLARGADAPYLLVECCPYTLAAFGHTVHELVALLEEYGYVVYNVDVNRLMRRRADEVQVSTVMDVLAAKQGVHGLPGWRVEPPMTRREMIERFVAESLIWNHDQRATLARTARELHPDVLGVPAITAALNRLSNDSEPMVRAAASWWREARAGAASPR